jgi:hypothetical protein
LIGSYALRIMSGSVAPLQWHVHFLGGPMTRQEHSGAPFALVVAVADDSRTGDSFPLKAPASGVESARNRTWAGNDPATLV